MKKALITTASAFALLMLGGTGCVVDDTYASCRSDSSCNDTADQCVFVAVPDARTQGGFCSYGCTTDAACESNFGFPGRCYEILPAPGEPANPRVCFQECDFDSDCWSFSLCVEVDDGTGFFQAICLPDNGAS